MYIRSGLGQGNSNQTPTPPTWWQQLIVDISKPFAEAGASRIAYGRVPPGSAGVTYQTPYGQGSFGAYGGFDPANLLLVGGLLVGGLVLAKAFTK